jgi:hypothetical protein
VDPTRCPDCGETLSGQECPSCGLALRGPLAAELWRVVVGMENLDRRRAELIARLRAGEAGEAPDVPESAWQPGPQAWQPGPQAWQQEWVRGAQPGARPAPARRPPKPRQEWTPQRVQNVLLVTGVLVLLVAAVVFTAYQWGSLPLWARGALMVAVTAVTGWGARRVLDRGLDSSAEAIAVLAVAFGAVDLYAVHAAGLVGDVSGASYWTVATALLAGGAAAFARYVPVRSVRFAALAAAQLPVVIAAANAAEWAEPWRGVVFGAQAAALLVVSRRLGGTAEAARWCGAANWAVAVALGLGAAYGTDPRPGAAVLALVAAVPLLWPGERTVTTGLVTASLVLAAIAPARADLTSAQLPAAVAAVGLLAVVAAASLPRGWREGPVAVGGGTVAFALAVELPGAATAVLAPLGWVSDVWRVTGDPAARAVVAPFGAWEGTVVTLGVVAVAAAAAALVGSVVERRALRVAAVLAAFAVVLVPLGLAWSYRAALAWDVAAGAAALAAAVVVKRPYPIITGCGVLAVATAWSLANEGATLAVLGAVAAAFAVVAVFAARQLAAGASATAAAAFAIAMALSRGTPVDRAGFVLATTACSLLAAAVVLRVESVAYVAGAAYAVALGLAATGPGWLAWTLALGVAVSGVRAAKDVRLAPVPAALATACAGVTAVAFGWPLERAAFAVTVAAAACVGAAVLLRDERLEGVAAFGYVVALGLAARDPGWLSWVLAAGGLVTLANAVRPERRTTAWAGALLLTGCSWVRLNIEHVEMPEAYAAPLALTALLFGHLRRRANDDVSSWSAYGGALTLGLGPTCWLLLQDPGVTRPVLLAAAAVAVLLLGMRERLQAPLAVGAGVLLLDALVQLGPVAAALPKWATLGLAGLAVITVGVTYEDRRRDVERLRRTYESLS